MNNPFYLVYDTWKEFYVLKKTNFVIERLQMLITRTLNLSLVFRMIFVVEGSLVKKEAPLLIVFFVLK